jgi:ribosomal protein S12 methylthiotransferase
MAAHLSVGFVSLGCVKNLVDSQIMAGELVKAGVPLARAPAEADVVIVNTCAFIADARHESARAIEDACRLKAAGNARAVVVAGCFPQREHARLFEMFPEVDAVMGVDELREVPRIIARLEQGERMFAMVSGRPHRLFDPGERPIVFSGAPHAYLKIAEGCNHRCAFCAIPAIRGRFRSRPMSRILAEAERLLEAGSRELDLVSQDVTAWGIDTGGLRLPDLLRSLGRIGGRFWIRILYGYPTRVDGRLLAAMAETEQVCPYLDVPIQHSHPAVLSAMRRADTIAAVRDLPERARRVMPDVALRTTCLLGFPGEREEHFRHLLRHVEAAGYQHLGAFAFSPEADTPALTMAGAPRASTVERRLERLLGLQRGLVAAANAARVGSEMTVLLERPTGRGRTWQARSRREAPEVDGIVRVSGVGPDARAGDFVAVRVTGARGYDLSAVCTPAARPR